jgi:hypothetical protein
MKKLVSTLLVAATLLACASDKPKHDSFVRCEPRYDYADQTNYDVHPDKTTPQNIAVDTSGLNINLAKVDRLTQEVEECLAQTFGNPPVLPPETVTNGQCVANTFELPIRRQCLTVKVASNWFLSKYEYAGTHHQQLPYTNGGMCTNKGLPAGVCYYRAGIQDDLTVVVPPSFYLYKDPLVRIVTGCRNPWYADLLANCMGPTTEPLDDGTQP